LLGASASEWARRSYAEGYATLGEQGEHRANSGQGLEMGLPSPLLGKWRADRVVFADVYGHRVGRLDEPGRWMLMQKREKGRNGGTEWRIESVQNGKEGKQEIEMRERDGGCGMGDVQTRLQLKVWNISRAEVQICIAANSHTKKKLL
jgi:hypothetical protein